MSLQSGHIPRQKSSVTPNKHIFLSKLKVKSQFHIFVNSFHSFRSNSSGSSVNSPSALGPSSSMANPYGMGTLYHSPGVQSYCGPTDNLSLAGHYTDMRSSAGWYGSTANDPRFASKCENQKFSLIECLPASSVCLQINIEIKYPRHVERRQCRSSKTLHHINCMCISQYPNNTFSCRQICK